jgi:diguanylate cyclase (GGDEF)-like protein/PAS domain S-box-containing protein
MSKGNKERFLNLSTRLEDYFFYIHNNEGIFTYVSDSIIDILGYTKEEFLKHYSTHLPNTSLNKNVKKLTDLAINGKDQKPYELEIHHKNGAIVILEVTELAAYDDDENIYAIEGFARDVTKRYYENIQLLQAQKDSIEIKKIFDESQKMAKIGSWKFFPEAEQIIWSDEAFRIFGFEPQSFEPTLEIFYNVLPMKDQVKVRKVVKDTIEGDNDCYEVSHYLNNGRYVDEIGKVFRDENGKATMMIGTVQDITEQHEKSKKIDKQKKQIEHDSLHDYLTKLPNRLMFFEQLNSSINFAERYKKNLAVLFIDLDRFKEINDGFGHDVGDEVLIIAAERLKNAVRKDDMVFRLGGDEFTIIAYDVNSIKLGDTICKKILDIFSKPITIDEHDFYVTCSIGISICPKDSSDSKNLLKYADAAMYKAKNEGKNTFEFYSSEMTEEAFQKVIMEASLKRAILNKEFLVYYQAQYECNSRKLIGSEALIRWNNPDIGIVSPMKFIPLAEETGMIFDIGEIVLREACSQIVNWYSKGYKPGKVAVNLAGKQILDKNLIPKVKKILSETKCKAKWLELEITEGFIMQEIDISRKNLLGLKKLGIELSIDDFGTGYSSLSYLKKLPVSKLKIDQSFIRDIEKDEDDKAIVRAIIAMSKSLSLNVLAEGIETDVQKQFLYNEGCNSGQGYFFSKPITALDFENLLINQVEKEGE